MNDSGFDSLSLQREELLAAAKRLNFPESSFPAVIEEVEQTVNDSLSAMSKFTDWGWVAVFLGCVPGHAVWLVAVRAAFPAGKRSSVADEAVWSAALSNLADRELPGYVQALWLTAAGTGTVLFYLLFVWLMRRARPLAGPMTALLAVVGKLEPGSPIGQDLATALRYAEREFASAPSTHGFATSSARAWQAQQRLSAAAALGRVERELRLTGDIDAAREEVVDLLVQTATDRWTLRSDLLDHLPRRRERLVALGGAMKTLTGIVTFLASLGTLPAVWKAFDAAGL